MTLRVTEDMACLRALSGLFGAEAVRAFNSRPPFSLCVRARAVSFEFFLQSSFEL